MGDNADMPTDDLLTIDETAAALDVARSTVYRWIDEHRLTPIHLGPVYKRWRPVRIRRTEVDAIKAPLTSAPFLAVYLGERE